MRHREAWQQFTAILNSRADVQMYAYELSKELEMEYESPPRPIIFRNPAEAAKRLETAWKPFRAEQNDGNDGNDGGDNMPSW